MDRRLRLHFLISLSCMIVNLMISSNLFAQEYTYADWTDDVRDVLKVDEERNDWYASAGAIILHRSSPPGSTIVAGNPNTSHSFLKGSDFNFDWSSGIDATLGRRIFGNESVEVRFFDVDGMQSTTAFVSPGAFIGAGFTGPAGTKFAGQDGTRVYNTEVNWRHRVNDRLSVLGGFRSVQLYDSLAVEINNTVATGQYSYQNKLYGAQLGTDLSLTDISNPLQLHVIGKAGLFEDSTNGGIYEKQNGNPIGSFTRSDFRNAFVGELGLTAGYRLTNHVTIRGGYELLWLDGLALAANNASTSLLNPSILRNHTDKDSLFFQGVTAALDVTW